MEAEPHKNNWKMLNIVLGDINDYCQKFSVVGRFCQKQIVHPQKCFWLGGNRTSRKQLEIVSYSLYSYDLALPEVFSGGKGLPEALKAPHP